MATVSVNVRKPIKSHRQPKQAETRVALIGLVVFLAMLGLVARLWYLQIFMGDAIKEQSLVNVTRTIPTRAPRGVIQDRRGAPFADSRQSLSLEIAPDYKKTNPDLLKRLAPLLKVTPEALEEQIKEEKRGYTDTVRVAENLTPQLVAQIEEQRLYLNGALIQPDPIRHYPMGMVATHLLGYLGMIDGEELKDLAQFKYRAGDYVGKTGIERRYNKWLRGEDGGRKVEVSPSGRIVRVLNEMEPHPGNTLTLAVDQKVQLAAQEALSAEGGKAGAAVAIDPRNGEVLALASYPTYDIRPFSTRRPKELWNPLLLNTDHPLQNRAIGAQYPPASTFKPLEACVGLNSGAIPANMTIFCEHGMRMGRQWKGCWKYHGWTNFERSISESCDVFYYTASKRMGIEQISEGAELFGLGRETGIDLGGEADGIVPDAKYRDKLKKRGEKWYFGDTANTSIGQGHLQATPLQMASAIAAIANGGTLYQPHLLKKATRWNHQLTYLARPIAMRHLPIRPDIIRRVQGAMRLTVTSGTGKMIALPNIPVSAKTGTAQTRKDKANHGWFVCYAPSDHPTIAIATIVEGGLHGGDAGGPVAKAMLQAYFHLYNPPPMNEAPMKIASPLRIQKKPVLPGALGWTPKPQLKIVETGQRFALLKGIQPPLPPSTPTNSAGISSILTPLGIPISATGVASPSKTAATSGAISQKPSPTTVPPPLPGSKTNPALPGQTPQNPVSPATLGTVQIPNAQINAHRSGRRGKVRRRRGRRVRPR